MGFESFGMPVAMSLEFRARAAQGADAGIEEDSLMRISTILAAALAVASFTLVAQQTPPGNPANIPPTQPGNPSAARETASPDISAATQIPAADLRPVKGELISKLDTKTAKAGDDVVVQTKAAVKTADGTEIPKGSKLMGHVVAVQSNESGQNSQVALKIDHAELTGGQSVPIQSQIQSVGSEGSAAPGADQSTSRAQMGNQASPGNSGTGGGSSGGAAGSASAAPGYTPGYTPSSPGANGSPAVGTVVARSGKIAIRTTAVPDVLLANNVPGQQDPRMAEASSILLGAKTDVSLSSGTPVVVGVATSSSSPGSSTR